MIKKNHIRMGQCGMESGRYNSGVKNGFVFLLSGGEAISQFIWDTLGVSSYFRERSGVEG